MKIALLGYGKMGQAVEAAATARGFTIIGRQNRNTSLADALLAQADLLIDFSNAEVLVSHVRRAATLGKPLVIGTTGWEDQQSEVRRLVEQAGIGAVHSPNFCLGIQLFHQCLQAVATLMNRFDLYDVSVLESHHRGKADSPSGYAKLMGDLLLKTIDRKTEILTELSKGPIKPHQLHISSIRHGSVPGIHSVFFDSSADTIELTHTARHRGGFAEGALLAGQWIRGKRGLIPFRDLFQEYVQ